MLRSDRSNYKILIVDDEPDILEFVGYNLQREGYQISQAGNGQDAVNLAAKIEPHLILLDIMMPEMDGVTTCHKIKKETSCKNTVIAFLTARHEEYSEIAGFEAGADDYIRKPVSPSVLKSRVRALLRRYNHIGYAGENKREHLDLALDREKFQASIGSDVLDLAKKEFEVLRLITEKARQSIRT